MATIVVNPKALGEIYYWADLDDGSEPAVELEMVIDPETYQPMIQATFNGEKKLWFASSGEEV